jgi:hypothetical protein
LSIGLQPFTSAWPPVLPRAGPAAWAGNESAIDGVAHDGVDVVGASCFAHRGEAGLERLLRVDGCVDRAVRGRLLEHRQIAAIVVDGREMGVHVDEAGEQRVPGEIDDLGAGGDLHLCGGADSGDAFAIHQNDGRGDLRTVADDQA